MYKHFCNKNLESELKLVEFLLKNPILTQVLNLRFDNEKIKQYAIWNVYLGC